MRLLFATVIAIALSAFACGSDDNGGTATLTASVTAGPSLTPTDVRTPTPTASPTPRPAGLGLGVYAIHPDGTGLRLVQQGFVTARLSPVDYRVASGEFCKSPVTVSVSELDQGGPVAIAHFDGILRDIEWSPQADQLLVSIISPDHQSNPMVYLLDPSGVNAPDSLFAGIPVWSPNADRIAYLTYDAGAATLNLFDLATRVSTVVDSSATIDKPIWSPDGSHMAYSRSASPSGNDPQVVVVDMNGEGRNVVVDSAYLNRWTAAGTRLVIAPATGEQNQPIAIALVDGSQSPYQIASGSVLDASADGSLFAIYSHIRQQETQIAILNQPTGASVVVSGNLTPTGDGVVLSPDDRQLGFTAGDIVYNSEGQPVSGSDTNPYVVGIDGTALLKLADGAYFRSWSADGQWAMIQSNPAVGCDNPFG